MFPIKYLVGGYSIENLPKAIINFITFSNTQSLNDLGHLWFLIALFWCFIFFTVLCNLLCIKKQHSLLLILIGIGLNMLSTLPIFGISSLNLGMQNLIWFILGFCFGEMRIKFIDWGQTHKVLNTSLIVLSGIMTLVNIVFFYQKPTLPTYLPPFLTVLFPTLVAGVFLYSMSNILVQNTKLTERKIFKVLITYAMTIYLLHDPINYAILWIFAHFGWSNTGFGIAIEIFVRFAGTITISILLGAIFEHIKKPLISRKQQ